MEMGKILVALGASVAITAAVAGVAFGGSSGQSQSLKLATTLKEMTITAPKSAVAGNVTFVAHNLGTVEHELVVIKGTSPLQISRFKASEAGRWVGEIDGVAPGKTRSVTLKLARGDYLLICNIVGHYQLGMATVLHVN
jgi:uncharacterized cupredoxin-like copper-binding protein